MNIARLVFAAGAATALCAAATPVAGQQSRALGAWQSGAPGEPVLRVQRLAPGTWVLRQGKRSNPEAPFLYLIAGNRRALLLDTGADTRAGTRFPIVETVDSLLATLDGARRPDSLIVLHSHGHGDHRAHDAQLAARPHTGVIAADTSAIVNALALSSWPNATGRIMLGGRDLLVVPTPGHERAHLMLYDVQTRYLFSGDMLYPGLLTVRDLAAFRASVVRLSEFAASHPIRAILGAHVEMSATPGRMYPLGTVVQPDEHPLALPASSIGSLVRMLRDAGDFVGELYGDDIALGRVSAPATDRPSVHGMLLFGRERLMLSHLPMARAPHDYQLVFEATLPDSITSRYRTDVATNDSTIYTVAPTTMWVLPNIIRHDTVFTADLYRGHFERGGERIARDVPVRVTRVVIFRRFEATDRPRPGDWFATGGANERFLVHRIAGHGDADQVVSLCAGAPRLTDGARVAVTVPATGLRAGLRTPAGRVCRVYYEERADLAKH